MERFVEQSLVHGTSWGRYELEDWMASTILT